MSDWNGTNDPRLDARLEGSEVFTVAANSTETKHIAFNFDCDLTGLEIYSDTANIGDSIDMSTEYYTGAVWLRYKKFGKSWNVFPNHVTRIILFPTSPKVGVRIAIKYTNATNTEVSFAVNKFQFINTEKVNPALGQQGTDW